MEPNQREIEYSRVLTLLDELDGKPFDSKNFTGWHPQAYGGPISQNDLDKATRRLCSSLKTIKINKHSLEMQTWWRDHKEADRRHKKEDADRKALMVARKTALAKLTPADRKALGL